MLDDKKLYKLIEPIIDTARQIEIELILSIAKRIDINDSIGGTARWQLEQLNKMGALHAETLEIIAKYSRKSVDQVKAMIKNAAISTINMDVLDRAYKSNLTPINPQFINFEPIIGLYQDNISKEMRVILSNAITESNKQYFNMIDKVVLEVTSGIKSYNQAIKDALNDLADRGIATTRYQGINKNGEPYIINYPIEASIRRSTMTAVNQVSNAVNAEVVDKLKPPQIAVSAHLGARNKGIGHENHESWQGQIYDNDGTFEEVTGYGDPDMLGLGGYNCRHNHYAYWEGISPKPENISTKENERAYALQQTQRKLERRVRDSRKRLELAKLSGDGKYLTKEKNLLKRRLNDLDEFTKKHSLKREYEREHIAKNYNPYRSPFSHNENYIDVTSEWLKSIDKTKRGKVIELDYFERDGIRYDSSNAKLDMNFGDDQREGAKWMADTFHEDIYLVPRPENVNGKTLSSSDSIFRKEPLEFKIVKGSGKDVIRDRIKAGKMQANNFVIEISKKSNLSGEDLNIQIESLFRHFNTKFVEIVIVRKENRLLRILKRKR